MASSWRLAQSLEVLRNQINAAYPNRSKASDGTKGDDAHAASASDHNSNAQGVVTAMDITNDPANGLDVHKLADHLITNRNPNLKYVISNGRIAGAWSNWQWEAYSGSNRHDKHVHISVGRGSDGQSTQPYDGTEPWDIQTNEEYVMTDEDAKQLFISIYHTNPKPEQYAGWVGKYTKDQARAERDTAAWAIQNHAITYFDQTFQALQDAQKMLGGSKPADTAKVDKAIKEAQEALDAAKALKN